MTIQGYPYVASFIIGALAVLPLTQNVAAQGVRIENTTAVFSALDKVTARISKIEIPLNETVKFGSLNVTPRVCYSRPATERPKTTSYVEIQEVQLDGKAQKIFSGWMFAESPALNAVEHPVFDVWLSDCKGGREPEVVRSRRNVENNNAQRRPTPQRRRRRIRR
ncbi:MAG: DUF2155 domain-containing protein [Hyphomicrobiaceae bacterium]